MTQKTNNTTNKEQIIEAGNSAEVAISSHVTQDLKNSLLVVSLVANLIVVTAWIAIQVTSQYDSQLASFLFTR